MKYILFQGFLKTTYQYSSVHCWQSRCFLTSLLQYLAKNMALLVQKFCGDFFLSEFVSGHFFAASPSFFDNDYDDYDYDNDYYEKRYLSIFSHSDTSPSAN